MKITSVAVFASVLLSVMSLATIVYAENADYVPGEIIIGAKEGIAPSVIRGINAQLGAEIIYEFKIINAYQLQLPSGMDVPTAIGFYKRQPGIRYAEPNYVVHADVIPNDPRFAELWGLHNTGQTGGTPDADIDAPEAWDATTGSEDIVVASIDTGVDYNHEDLAANMWTNPGEIPGNGMDDDSNGFIDDVYGWDFVNDDNDPMDDYGHGTHTSGTIGAVGNNGIGITGVCWNVKIMALKFIDATGYGSTADAVKCVEYATIMNARLSNNSWGDDDFSQALYDAIKEGPLFIAAAGNDGLNTDKSPHYPSSYDLWNIISVAATNQYDRRAIFSNYGVRSVDLAAPGVGILSTVPGDDYDSNLGTSMAAPHVAGVAALIMSVSDLGDFGVKMMILISVDRLPSLRWRVRTWGRLNAEKALRYLTATAPPLAIGTDTGAPLCEDAEGSSLGNAFPVPANPEVWIPYRLGAGSDVTVTIYRPSGQVIRTLELGHHPAGIYEDKQLAAYWDGRNANGETVASGVYFYTLKAGDFAATRKLLIIR